MITSLSARIWVHC